MRFNMVLLLFSLTVIPLALSFAADKKLPKKQQAWREGCVGAFVTYAEKLKDRSVADGRKLGEETCTDLTSSISRSNRWSEVSDKTPRFEGCLDAVNLMLDTSEVHDPKKRKSMLADFCLDVK
jgi:hypothetical protein